MYSKNGRYDSASRVPLMKAPPKTKIMQGFFASISAAGMSV